MAKTYDTAELRRIASVINASAEELSLSLRNTLRWVMEDVPDHLSGSSADALEETVTEMNEKISEYSVELDDIGTTLKKYAFLLDQADKKAMDMIQSR